MKITFEDWDDVHANAVIENVDVSKVHNLTFYYDRGRLEVFVNGEPVFKMCEGTQDFSLNLDIQPIISV